MTMTILTTKDQCLKRKLTLVCAPAGFENLPTQFTIDMRLSRKFHMGAIAVEPLFEVFNVLNRTNYSDVNNIFGAGAFPGALARDAQGHVTYGTFTQAQAPRQIQLSAKVSFQRYDWSHNRKVEP